MALAALCIVGVSSQASATTIATHDQLYRTNIAIDSSKAQFYYDSYLTAPDFPVYSGGDLKADFGAYNTATFSTDPYTSFGSGSTNVYKNSASFAYTGYIELAFTNKSGQAETAQANFTNGDLVSITGDDITSVTASTATPLPTSWALLASGSAVFGLIATRRRRKRQLVS